MIRSQSVVIGIEYFWDIFLYIEFPFLVAATVLNLSSSLCVLLEGIVLTKLRNSAKIYRFLKANSSIENDYDNIDVYAVL